MLVFRRQPGEVLIRSVAMNPCARIYFSRGTKCISRKVLCFRLSVEAWRSHKNIYFCCFFLEDEPICRLAVCVHEESDVSKMLRSFSFIPFFFKMFFMAPLYTSALPEPGSGSIMVNSCCATSCILNSQDDTVILQKDPACRAERET